MSREFGVVESVSARSDKTTPKRQRDRAKRRQLAIVKLRCKVCDKLIKFVGISGPLPSRCYLCKKLHCCKRNAASLAMRRKARAANAPSGTC